MKAGFYARGLVAAGVVTVIALAVLFAAGGGWAFAVLLAGLGAIVVHDVHQRRRLTDWAAAPMDAPVPDARGAWKETFSALHRRTRTRNAVQRDLSHTIERFRRAAEAIPDGMVLLDTAGRIRWANSRAERHLGVQFPGDEGRPLVNLVRQPEVVAYLARDDRPEPLVVESTREPNATLAIQLVPFGVEEALLISRDISRLEAVARMRRDFIANVSHELKTPLTVITGFVETLRDMELEPRQQDRYLQLMQEQARNMQRLVNDLLTLSALESEQNPLQETPFAVVPLLLSLSADAKALSQGQHEVALDIGDAATVVGNRDELASACGNLVSNAVRYSPPGGRITLSWRVEADGTGVFAVKDTGLGIAPEHLPRLTERFYRVDRSRSRATGGTGLGLAIVKHVLIRHQAELGIESALGEGSTFSVRLPPSRVRRSPRGEIAAEALPAAQLPRDAGD